MPFLKNITQRLFGRTVIDSLDLNQNAWYIDEEQVTVTAAQLNGASILPATSQTVDLTNDDILFLDHSGSHAMAYDDIPGFLALVAGTSANSGITSTNGVFKVDPHVVTAETPASGDLFLFSDEGTANDPLRSVTIDNYAAFLAGAGMTALNGVLTVAGKGVTALKLNADTAGTGLTGGDGAALAHSNSGSLAVGSLYFGAVGDCTDVVIGGTTYTVGGGAGQWAVGADAKASATNLAGAINAGTTHFAVVDTEGDTVLVTTKTVGIPVPATITRTGGAQPATLENLTGGAAASATRQCMIAHTVTANESGTTAYVIVPLPFAPSVWTVQVRSATGLIKDNVTDLFTLGTVPNRIICTEAGAGTHVVATDVITVFAQE